MIPDIEYLERGVIQKDWTIWMTCRFVGMPGCHIEVCPHRNPHLQDPTCSIPCAVSHEVCQVKSEKRAYRKRGLSAHNIEPRVVRKI